LDIVMHLIIGNKLYSSWSLRPWILMEALDLPFDETVIPLHQDDTAASIKTHASAGKVPILKDGNVMVWESLAIMEYLHEKFPNAGIWPKDATARAHARCIANEMHAGFQPLRQACPMNLGKSFKPKDYADDVKASVARVEAIWSEARSRFGSGGPFLYGAFSAADAMYAPIVTRLDTYGFPVSGLSRAYMDAVLTSPAFVAWRDAAFREPWYLPHYEAGHTAIATHYQPKA
jgi:glutathione S-transferase